MNSIRQKSDEQDYYDVCRKCLLMCGQWPYQKIRERLFCTSVIITWLLSVIVAQIAQFSICKTTQCILRTLPMHLAAWIAILKLLTCHFSNQRIKYLMEQLYANWSIFDTQEELEIMRRYAANSRWYSAIYIIYAYACLVIFGATTLLPRILDVVFPLNESRPILLPCPAYYFVDEAEYFYYIVFHLMFGATLGVFGLVAHDSTFLTYVEHVCSLLTVVGFRFEHFLYKHNITKKCLIDASNDVYAENIAFTIQVHQKAMQFASLVEDTFTLFLAIQILIICIGLSSTLIQISMELDGDMIEVVRYILFVIGQLIHLLIFSFQGQKLTNHSLSVHSKIYNGLWYNLPVKSQKLLLFAMKKSSEIMILSAGKIFVFSLESFALIIKTSVSYFTILSSVSEQ